MKPCRLACIGLALPFLMAAAQPPAQPTKPGQPTRPNQPTNPTPTKIDQPESMSGNMEDPAFRDSLATQEKKMWEDVKSQNWTEFEGSLSDRFMAICPTGFQSKAQAMAEMKKGKLNSYNLGDWHAVKLSDSAGIIMYRVEMDGSTPTGKPNKGTCFCSSTWSKKGGKWVCDSHQTTMQDESMEK